MIVVFGTLNVDLVIAVDRLPGPGGQVKGADHQLLPGGKGANQALAAARAGARVRLVGAVGDDPFAAVALAGLKEAGVDLAAVARVDRPTGLNCIAVGASGENMIFGATAANGDASAEALAPHLGPGTTLLVQNSLPAATIGAAIAAARLAGGRIVFNTAPADGVAEASLAAADVIVANRHEAAALAHHFVLPEAADAFARALARRVMATVVVTLDGDGLVAATPEGRLLRGRPAAVAVVDTTGAGDALIGTLAAALDRGASLDTALREGLAAGAAATRTAGARSGPADRAELGRWLAKTPALTIEDAAP